MARRLKSGKVAPKDRDGFCPGISKSGKPCRNKPGAGTNHLGYGQCSHHGGNSPASIIATAKTQIAEQQAKYGVPITIEPHQFLLEEVYRCAGNVEWLRTKVMELADDEKIESSIAGKHPNVWIRWYQDERTKGVIAASACIKAGIAEREVRIMEDQGRMLAGVIQAFIIRLGLTPDQQRAAPGILRELLTAMPVERAIDVA